MNDPTPRKKLNSFEPFIYPIGNTIKLSSSTNSIPRELNFLDVMYTRRSKKVHEIPTLEEISEVLYHSCRIMEIDTDESGIILTKRMTPSGGSRHPIDLLISFPERNRAISLYNPLSHSLSSLKVETNNKNSFLDKVCDNLDISNSCLVWFSIQIEKCSSKYINPSSIYWKDLGALLYCIQLFANYFGLKSCPLGTLALSEFNTLFNTSKLTSGGGIIIGK